MQVCPICGTEYDDLHCTCCGYDESLDYERYPTLQPIPKKCSSNGARRANPADADKEKKKRLWICGTVIWALLVVIVAIVISLLIMLFRSDKNTTKDTELSSKATSTAGELGSVPCTGMQLSSEHLELSVGDTWTIGVLLSPVDTTDIISFFSENPDIASVDSRSGKITMLAEGETVIIVICGEVTAKCTVITPASSDDDPVIPDEFNLEFNTPFVDEQGNGQHTLTVRGETWKAYKYSLIVDPSLILWTTNDPAIVTIENGIVTAVASGTTMIHAQYNGVTYSCVISCNFVDADGKCSLNLEDVTIFAGDTFTLKLRDPSGSTLSVIWECDTDGVIIDGNRITGVNSGVHRVYTVYEGETYICIVRVK